MSGKSLFKTAGLIAVLTILSKIIGFWRDIVIAGAYGATMVSDAYYYAYQIPSLSLILLGGLGGPFHTATVAIFSKMIPNIDEKPPEEAKTLVNSFITLTGLVFLVLSVLIFVYADPIMGLIISDNDSSLVHLAANQLKLMSPMLFIGGVIGIFYGISNVYKEFLYTSLSPVMASLSIIIGIMIWHDDKFGYMLAIATLVGAVGQFFFQVPKFLSSGFFYKPQFDFKNKNMKKLGEILFPAMLGTTIGQTNTYIDMFFSSQLETGAWSAIGYANRLFQFPVGVIITAFLVPLFPMFSSFVGQKDWTALNYYFKKGLGMLFYIAFPIAAILMIFSKDAVYVLFERGAFDAKATLMVAESLFFLSISIIPYVARDTLTRMFYAFDDSRTPFIIAMLSILSKTILNFLLVKPLGIGGITLSTTFVTLINAILLAFLLRKKIDLKYREFISPLTKITAVTVIMALIVVVAGLFWDKYFVYSKLFVSIKLCILSVVAMVLFFVLSTIFKIPYYNDILVKLKLKKQT